MLPTLTNLLLKKNKKQIASRALDIISAPLSQPKTVLTKGIFAGADAVKQSRQDIARGRKSATGTILTTLGSTAVLGAGILAAGGAGAAGAAGGVARTGGAKAARFIGRPLGKAALGLGTVAVFAPKTFGTFIKTPGAFETALSTAVNPLAGAIVGLERGTGLLKTGINNFLSNLDTKDVLKTAGGVAALGGAALIGKNIYNNAKNIPAPSLPSVSFGNVPAMPPQNSSNSLVFDDVTPTTTEKTKQPNIKNTFKPQINIAIAN
jgi:hypothetical protein